MIPLLAIFCGGIDVPSMRPTGGLPVASRVLVETTKGPIDGTSMPQKQEGPLFPKTAPTTIPNAVRDWDGFKYLPPGARTFPAIFPVAADWSAIKGSPAPGAGVWRAKVVILDRVDRVHERGKDLVWSGHHFINTPDLARVRRSLAQFRALAANASGGAIDVSLDISEETEPQSIQGGDITTFVGRYLAPRINGGTYQAEDGVFRGPYQSVFVIHPVGGESDGYLEVQGTPVALVGIPDVEGQDADGVLASALYERWRIQVLRRGEAAGLTPETDDPAKVTDWPAVLLGADAPTETRLRLLALSKAETLQFFPNGAWPCVAGPRGPNTTVRLAKDPERGNVLVVEEGGAYRAGGFALPQAGDKFVDTKATPTLAFWVKSSALDPIVVQLVGRYPVSQRDPFIPAVRLGVDVPFAYDGVWHRVKIDLRSVPDGLTEVVIGPDPKTRERIKETLGPIVASFDDFEATTEAPDAKPTPEAPSPTAASPTARAAWAVAAGPGEARRVLFKDPIEAIRANALAAALARPDAGDEGALIDAAMYNFEPTVFGPALQALGNLKTTGATEGLQRALRTAASDRARGLAAEVLAQSGDPKLVPYFLGLNQSRSRASRVSGIRALGRLPGEDAAKDRMAYLPQDDPEIKMEATLTADANDDYQGRKLLWSAVNEPSDAVRLESLRRLSYSTVAEFAEAGLKGVRDDSVGVRVGLLEAWAGDPRPAFPPAIKLALADASPRVRAAALHALAASPDPVAAADVSAAFEDADPQVQLALLALSAKKGIEIPPAVREWLRKSPDPKVRAAAG